MKPSAATVNLVPSVTAEVSVVWGSSAAEHRRCEHGQVVVDGELRRCLHVAGVVGGPDLDGAPAPYPVTTPV